MKVFILVTVVLVVLTGCYSPDGTPTAATRAAGEVLIHGGGLVSDVAPAPWNWIGGIAVTVGTLLLGKKVHTVMKRKKNERE